MQKYLDLLIWWCRPNSASRKLMMCSLAFLLFLTFVDGVPGIMKWASGLSAFVLTLIFGLAYPGYRT